MAEIYLSEELKMVQSIEFEMLREVDRICKKHNIEYFIVAGTALGAVRHQDFIPWDDDIDIGMVRDQYERFLEAAPKELKSCYFLQTRDTDKHAPFSFAKLRKNGTMFIEWPYRFIKMHHGIYIDIFPFDNLPDDYLLRKKHFRYTRFLSNLIILKSSPLKTTKPNNILEYAYQGVLFLLYLLACLIPFKLIDNILYKLMTKFNKKDTKSLICMVYPSLHGLIERDWLFPIKKVEFRKMLVNAPFKIEKYLEDHYGNYMELPPPERRVGHKPFKISF